MANNFNSTEVTLTSASETTIVSATANKQILIGLNAANTSASSITLTFTLNDGSNDYKFCNAISVPPNSKVEVIKGKYVLATGYSLKATSSASGGDCDVIVGLLTDVS